jgi:hypothetical protein
VVEQRSSPFSRRQVPLREAPVRFLASEWARLVELTGSEAGALEILTNPTPGMLSNYRQEAIEHGSGSPEDKAKWKKGAEIDQLAKATTAELKAMLASGQLVGFGIFSLTDRPQKASSKIWMGLHLDFQNSKATAPEGKGSYSDVTIGKGASPRASDELVASISAWLTKRLTENGSEKRVALMEHARTKYDARFRITAFDQAFREVYGHKRGRPTGSTNNQKIKD